MTFKLDDDFVAEFKYAEESGAHPLLDSFNGLGLVVYRRTYSRPIYDEAGEYVRHEEWHETVRRVVEGAQAIGAGLTRDEAEKLYELIWAKKALVGGRMLWQLGTDNVERLGSASLVNCYYTDLSEPDDFRFLFEMLMLGGGVGFNVTPESVAKLPEVKAGYGAAQLQTGYDVDFIVPDNRQGWGELLVRILEAHFDGVPFSYSVDAVRPEGAPIKTFGGTASGPGILVEGADRIETILGEALGRKLTTVEVLDIANIIGSIVVSGNVRRSAQIALGDAEDLDYLAAKRWDLGHIPPYRAMSNNTVFVRNVRDLPDDFWEGYLGNGEAYGLYNVAQAQRVGRTGEARPDITIKGVNPCGEIPLAHRESCNLAELVLPNFDDLPEAIIAAGLLYKVQKAIAGLHHPDPSTERITHINRRLGMGVTGVAQSDPERLYWLDIIYRYLRDLDEDWSLQRGIPESVRLTTVKPSGTLSLLAGVTPGVHPGYSRYHVRRMRVATTDPVFAWCEEQGLPWEFVRDFEGNEDPRTAVIEFPCEFPEGTRTADETSAVEQMKMARLMQERWADNAVSVTVTFRPEELDEVKEELAAHWHATKSISFLPYSEHGFDQAPLEPITEEEYRERLAAIDLRHEKVHGHSEMFDADCATGACPIR